MDEDKEKKAVKEKVLAAIQEGRIKMRPRWRFVLSAALIATGAAIFLLALLYLVSFIFFVLHQTGIFFLPELGGRGLSRFFFSLPWMLILLSLVFLLILEAMVRRYKFAYRRPLLYSLLAVAAMVIVGGFLAERTGFHHRIFIYARTNHLPVAGVFYRSFGAEHLESVHRGQILSLSSSTLVLADENGSTSTVLMTSETSIPPGTVLKTGDTVVVFGDIRNGLIQAEGVVEAP